MRYCKSIILPFAITLISVCFGTSCKKLHEPPSTELQPPSTLEELAALFYYQTIMNYSPGLNELSADNLYQLYDFWLQRSPVQQNAYLWKPDIYGGDTAAGDYDLCSAQVLNANIVLEDLQKMSASSNPALWNKLKGMALFFRSWAVYNMAQLYAPAYDPVTAYQDLGVPLRQSSSTSEKTTRATVEQTYDQITRDLQEAVPLLPAFDAINNNLPSKPAAYAMLARVYQSMNQHQLAERYADSCLGLYNQLLNYNTLSISDRAPFNKTNPEIIFKSNVTDKADALYELSDSGCIIDSVLYQSYATNDLRLKAFYIINEGSGLPISKKSYNGIVFPFTGLASDEMYLIRAESRARAGNTTGAMNDLNALLKNRWATGTFVPFTTSPDSTVNLILQERRKELPFRGLRWTDLRRLNKEGYNIKLTRNFNNTTYTLLPNDRLYVLPFPADVISVTGMPQNPR